MKKNKGVVMQVGFSARRVRSARISVRSLYRLIRGGQYRQPNVALPCIDMTEVDDGESGHGWYLYAGPDEVEVMDLAREAVHARSLKLVQIGAKG
jgi:hypothetical protein